MRCVCARVCVSLGVRRTCLYAVMVVSTGRPPAQPKAKVFKLEAARAGPIEATVR